MKLRLKLAIAFAASQILMLFASLYAIYSLNQSLNGYAIVVQSATENERTIAVVAGSFKTQVQEWKNVLLRGKTPKDLEKYWGSFSKHEAEVSEKAKKLHAALAEGEVKLLVERFVQAHEKMGSGYRSGLEAFKTAGFDPSVGDLAVKGIDRAPSAVLDEATQKISQVSASAAHEADLSGRSATAISTIALLVLFCQRLRWHHA